MAAERIQLIIDVLTGNASGPLSKLKTDLAEADGAFAKTKVAASGLWDNMKAHAGTAALAAGAALTSFAVKAVGDFQDTALGAGKLRDSLGITADEASRLQEVAGDLGIGVGTLEKSMGLMSRTAANAPEKFDAIGAAIERNRDGSVNVTETYLNVIDALKRIKDPTERAARAQEVLGRAWMDSAELIEMGADDVRAAMAGVEDAKIIDDKEIATARQFRDTLDDLKGVVESASVAIGGELVPVLTDAAETLESLVGPLQKVRGAFDAVTNAPGLKQIYENFAPWEQIPTRIGQVNDILQFFGVVAEDAAVSSDEAAAAVGRYTGAFESGFSWIKDTARAHEELSGDVDNTRESMVDTGAIAEDLANNQLAALESAAGDLAWVSRDLASALDETFGSATDLQGAADELAANIDATTESLGTNGATLDQNTEKGRANREQLRRNVEGVQDYIRKLIESGASSETAAAEYDANRAVLVNQARQFGLTEAEANDYINKLGATPDAVNTAVNLNNVNLARGLIADHISRLGAIPANKLTDIMTAADTGELDRVKRSLASLERNIIVRVQTIATGGAYSAPGVNRAVAGGGTIQAMASGGGSDAPTLLVGENGPEIVRLPVGSHVYKENETRGMRTTPAGGDTFNIYGADKAEILAELQAIRWRQNATPTPGARR